MKTAVEWLEERLNRNGLGLTIEEIKEAKEMDKAERAKEYLNGFKDGKEYMKKIQTFESK
jgi:hypothetical protein